MNQTRNIIYQTKKNSNIKQGSIHNIQKINQHQQIKQEINNLRIKNRSQQTQIFRLKTQLDQSRQKIFFYQQQLKINCKSNQNSINKINKQNSISPYENLRLKQEIQHIHEINLTLNAKNRQLQALNRQLQSDIKKEQKKIKQLQFLQQLKCEKFKTQHQMPKIPIIEQNKQFEILVQGLKKINDFMRKKVISVSYQIFLSSSRECQNEKKSNSFNIFINYWNQFKKHKHLGYLSLVQSQKSLSELQKYLNYDQQILFDSYGQKYRDTLNQWIIKTISEIKLINQSQINAKKQKLFRLLSLYYRAKFPIKGQTFQIDSDVQKAFQDLISVQILQNLNN